MAIFETFGALLALRLNSGLILWILAWGSSFLEILLPLIAGLLAARATSERSSGLIAGFTAGLIVAIVNMIGETFMPSDTLFLLQGQVPLAGNDLVASAIFARLMTLGLGAWGGWLGGRLGQFTRSRPPHP
ncbi:MAG TPA: DUF5518 domain-containing protein [Chloroflexia bacterium]|nr:DUF5518 domain-containing protein [Chloroflexia bacterium]